ncbi:MAG: hypothetical protein WAV52_09315, partial [Luteococcus japonicus]
TSLDARGIVDERGGLHARLEFTVDFADVEAHGIWIALPTQTPLPGENSRTSRLHTYHEIRASSPQRCTG